MRVIVLGERERSVVPRMAVRGPWGAARKMTTLVAIAVPAS
jgi:hypothetical protein